MSGEHRGVSSGLGPGQEQGSGGGWPRQETYALPGRPCPSPTFAEGQSTCSASASEKVGPRDLLETQGLLTLGPDSPLDTGPRQDSCILPWNHLTLEESGLSALGAHLMSVFFLKRISGSQNRPSVLLSSLTA